jgi:hypothetical protein
MKSKTPLSQLIRLFGFVFLIDLVVIAIVAGIGWWAGWQSQEGFKGAIQLAGILVIGIGFLGIKGNRDGTRSFKYQSSRSTTRKSSWERTQQYLVDFAQSYSFMLVMFVAGAVCLAIGWLM